jgi:AcrR family transcriptional regulator
VTRAARPLGRPRSEQVEAAIVSAATGLLAEVGYQAMTIEAIAARAGVAKTTVYRRWDGKDELVLEVLSRLKGPVGSPLGESVRDDLVLLLGRVRAQWLDGLHGRLLQRLSAEAADRPEFFRAYRRRLVAPRQAVIAQVLQRGVDEGLIAAGTDLDWVRDLLVAPILAAGYTHRNVPGEAQLRFYVDTVLAGLRPEAESGG